MRHQTVGAKTVVFPCTDDRALVSRPFCGLLAPPAMVSNLSIRTHGMGKTSKKARQQQRHWECWLCSASNRVDSETCVSCARDRRPSWLCLADGSSLEVGCFVKIRNKDVTRFGLVTQIDYRQRTVQTFSKMQLSNSSVVEGKAASRRNPFDIEASGKNASDEPEEKEADEKQGSSNADNDVYHLSQNTPQCTIIQESDIVHGAVSLVVEKEMALSLCNYMLCGICGSVSRLSNGHSVLDSEEDRMHKKGVLRQQEKEYHDMESNVRFLTRKWRQSKQGFKELNVAQQKLREAERTLQTLRRELAPFQFWCSACSWQWPDDRPWQIP